MSNYIEIRGGVNRADDRFITSEELETLLVETIEFFVAKGYQHGGSWTLREEEEVSDE